MRIFGYIGIGFLIVWLLVPASIAVAQTTTIQTVTPDVTQSPSQPTSEEDDLDLLSLDD